MKYLLGFCFVLLFVGCETDTPPSVQLTKINAIDSVHFSYDSMIRVIVVQPIKGTPIRIDTSSMLRDSAILYTYSSAAVRNSFKYEIRKPTYFLLDTFYLQYDNVVDSLNDEGTVDEFRIDSLYTVLPSIRTPMIIQRP